MPHVSVKVDEKQLSPVRLDRYCASFPDGINRSRLKNSVTELLLNGKNVKLSAKVSAGDIIDIFWEENISDDIIPENIPLDIVYENTDVTIVNKKQGMVTHPAAGNWSGTLVNALLFHWGRDAVHMEDGFLPASKILSSRRPGIVHRLDKDTSGLLITARTRDAEEWLQIQFRDRHLVKEYIAIVKGCPPVRCGEIKTQIMRDPKNRKRFVAAINTDAGKFAHTLFRCIASYGPYSLMRIRLVTGRTHQIRVHMKYLQCPVLGDPLYGKKDSLFDSATLMLHARTMKIRLPGSHRYSRFTAAVPVRFKKVLKTLHNSYSRKVLPRNKDGEKLWTARHR
jgi:23S rRNA pseudouridine1911/1915/1917 synthase